MGNTVPVNKGHIAGERSGRHSGRQRGRQRQIHVETRSRRGGGDLLRRQSESGRNCHLESYAAVLAQMLRSTALFQHLITQQFQVLCMCLDEWLRQSFTRSPWSYLQHKETYNIHLIELHQHRPETHKQTPNHICTLFAIYPQLKVKDQRAKFWSRAVKTHRSPCSKPFSTIERSKSLAAAFFSSRFQFKGQVSDSTTEQQTKFVWPPTDLMWSVTPCQAGVLGFPKRI